MQQFRDSIADLSSDQQGIYVASILLASSLSSLASGHVADAVSRRYGILVSAIISMIGAIISATAPNFAALIVARLVTGFGLGQAFSVTTVYLVEIAPKNIRGVAACVLQTYVVLGITVGYFVCYGTQNLTGTIAWRTPFILQACVSVILASGMLFLPFSPRWLCQKGRFEEATQVLAKMRRWAAIESEMEEMQGISIRENVDETKWIEMFHRRYIGRTMLGVFLMFFQQLTGVGVDRPCGLVRFADDCTDRRRAVLRPYRVLTGGLHLSKGQFPRLCCQWYCHAGCNNPRTNLDRSMGPPDAAHARRYRDGRLLHHQRRHVCQVWQAGRRRSSDGVQGCSMGRGGLDLYLSGKFLLVLGCGEYS